MSIKHKVTPSDILFCATKSAKPPKRPRKAACCQTGTIRCSSVVINQLSQHWWAPKLAWGAGRGRKLMETLEKSCDWRWRPSFPRRERVGLRFVQILKKSTSGSGAAYGPTPHVKPAYIDILWWAINVRFLHHGGPPSSSLKRRNVTKSLAVFPFQKWPVALHPCQRVLLGSTGASPL